MTKGEHTYGWENIKVRGVMNNITIGKYCSIADNVTIDGGFNHNTKFVSTFPFFNRIGSGNQNIVCNGDVTIGSDVWIGENVMIMSGVRIGHGAIIGANAVVTKDVMPYTIVGGVPAKPIKKRFTMTQIGAMLTIKWWDWGHVKVLENVDLLTSENIEPFIEKHL